MRRRGLALSMLLASAGVLGGCVAAVVPIAAGAIVGKRQIDGPKADKRAVAVAAPAPMSVGIGDVELEITNLAALPPPGRSAPFSGGGAAIQAFADYALQQAGSGSAASRESALLAAPASLSPERAPCSGRPPAIIIDLDPRGDVFDPLSVQQPDPALAGQLARLRRADIAVFWSSHLPENFAGDLRAVLTRTGLDPDGKDVLLTLASLDDRKQTRRESVGATHCAVAILGDEKADFDELYAYLRNPGEPVGPDALVGAGWFLAAPFPNSEGN